MVYHPSKVDRQWVYANGNFLVKTDSSGYTVGFYYKQRVYAVYRCRPSGTPLGGKKGNFGNWMYNCRF